MKKAVVVCSGGLDSVTCAYYVKKKLGYHSIHLIFFDYGQKSLAGEHRSMIACAKDLKAIYKKVKLESLKELAFSGLTHQIKAKKIARIDLKNTGKESSKFYLPFRNTVFASYALAYAETLLKLKKDEVDIFFGFKCEGSESYSDTTQAYVDGLNDLIKKMNIQNIRIKAPFIKKDKEDIILIGAKLNVPLERTFSCYLSDTYHCGTCLACALRKEGFYWANIQDKTNYLEK